MTTIFYNVIVNAYKSNVKRIGYLRDVKSYSLVNIFLYYNPNSSMSADEITDWNSNTGMPTTPQIIPFSGANMSSKANNPAAFATDFGAGGIIPSAAMAIVISADPFFGANKDALMSAVNGWLGAASGRFVVYPFQDYILASAANLPAPSKGAYYGPDLKFAYKLLGVQAREVYDIGQDVGFLTAADILGES